MATIFISHASADRQLALIVKELLIRALRKTPTLTVFCSSDIGDMESGKKWFDQIMLNLRKASACVAIMTPQSVHSSPWVAYEAGGAYLRFQINPRRSRLFPVCAYGMTGAILPSPFNELQVRNLADRREVQILCREVATCLGHKRATTPRGTIRDVVAEASHGSPHWAYVDAALVGQRQGRSPFSIDSLIRQASTDVFCAGFALHHIATTPQVKDQLFDFLRVSSTRSVRIVISDPGKRRLFAGLRLVGETFLDDLQDSIRHFQNWLLEAKKEKLKGTLEVRRAPFIALTVNCIDPESSNGQLVVTPHILGKPLSAERPHVWLSRRRNPAVFSYYWDSYHDLFRRSVPL